MCKQKVLMGLLVLVLTGCATKHYPQAAAVTPQETATLNCNVLDQELSKAYSVQSDIEQTGQFNALTVLGFVGDFGLGNGIAKYNATRKVEKRVTALQSLKAAKCSQRLS
ncbi:hypothetical protein NIM72_17070 [Pantoea sp. B550]|uniref:hypothetical protein n=1 Tax=Pantoea TaxID=53335 RepID=UPI000E86DF71|nr:MULTISPECIES: hypothetical protein [Pantoea]HBV91078.1 hypothetical protein [Pantoea sp.]MCP1207222.1 hypothetical protein [Pantoea sp. B550]MCT2416454.1 hypothetical protein [Pantoea sp. XY16]QZX94835.1 hypothetical protein K6R05_13865 [Pantoea alfalfae]WIL41125.1 hypothetical protein QPJ96_14085 [Pantoea agglomerans]